MNNGTIHLIIGPMFSGKTTELIRLKTRSDIIAKGIVIRYMQDTRFGNDEKLYTHNNYSTECIISDKDSLKNTILNIKNIDDIKNFSYI